MYVINARSLGVIRDFDREVKEKKIDIPNVLKKHNHAFRFREHSLLEVHTYSSVTGADWNNLPTSPQRSAGISYFISDVEV
jgi:hypothetical protein